MYTELMIIGGIFWSLTYILIIRRGFIEKTYGMPLIALCANISWEAIFSFLHPHSPPQLYINYMVPVRSYYSPAILEIWKN